MCLVDAMNLHHKLKHMTRADMIDAVSRHAGATRVDLTEFFRLLQMLEDDGVVLAREVAPATKIRNIGRKLIEESPA